MLLKDRFIETVVKAYPYVAQKQTAEGWFAYDVDKYTIYSQYAGYYLSWLYAFEHPLNPYHAKAEVLARAVSVWDHYASMINDEGLCRIISGNQDYGYGQDEWGLFYWIKTVDLLRDCLPLKKAADWDGLIHRIACLHGDMIRHPERQDNENGYNFRRNFAYHTSNHYIWALLAYYLYGMLYGDAGAMGCAAGVMEEVFDHQLPCGCWLECGSPTVRYNDVSLSAISIYEYLSKNKRAERVVRKGLDYVLNTIYPDFTRIETLDGRNRYGKKHAGLGAPTYCRYEDGRAYLSKWIGSMEETNELGENLHSLANVTAMIEAIPGDAPFVAGGLDRFIPASTDYAEIKARITRTNGWVVPFCCLEQVEYENRYVLFRQNLMSVYNDKTGLLIGGGSSIAQSEFSCFNVIAGDKLYYMHKEGSVLPDGGGMSLKYGGKHCAVRVSGFSPSGMTIEYSVEGLSEVDRATVNIPLVGQAGAAITIHGEQARWGRQQLSYDIPSGSPVSFRSAEMTLSEDGVFKYPVFPYNSYSLKQQKDFNEVFGIITVELDYLRPKCSLVIKV